jgi:redox-sensing transcriptional repressor
MSEELESQYKNPEDIKKISLTVVRRLPRYYRFLEDLINKGIYRASSKELSERLNVTASQIRQDLNNFGCFGQQGYGYNIVSLRDEIKKILGLDKFYRAIIIGAGTIGKALANYGGFRHFDFIAAFDSDKKIVGTLAGDLIIKDAAELEEYLSKNEADICVLAVPKSEALKMAKIAAQYNVKGIWNFSAEDLESVEGVHIEDVHLTDSLMTLSYKINKKYFSGNEKIF